MVTRSQKVRLGVFVVVSGALLVGTLAVLAGLKMSERRDEYTVRFTVSVSGLEVGAQVKYNGVRVGQVEAVKINRENVSEVVVTLSLDHETPIKKDTRAVLNMSGITGLKFIELTLGSRESDFLEPGDEIPAGESFLDRLSGQAEEIAQKAELVLNNVNKMLDEENRQRVTAVLANVEEFTGAAADLATSATQLVDENRDNVRAITSSLAEAAAGFDGVVEDLHAEILATLRVARTTIASLGETVDRDQVRSVLSSVERLMNGARRKVEAADVEGVLAKVSTLAERATRLMTNIDLTVLKSREDLFASLNYLLEGLENFSEFARMLRENPSLLLRGPSEEERQLP